MTPERPQNLSRQWGDAAYRRRRSLTEEAVMYPDDEVRF